MKAITSIKRILTLSSLVIAGALIPGTAPAAQLTYDLRVVASSNPQTDLSDPHSVSARQPGEVLTVNIYALVQNNDGNHANDGFQTGQGSIISTGALKGDLRGDTSTRTLTNNVAPFNFSSGAQSGYLADLDGDGDLDLGTTLTTANGLATLPWFNATSVNVTSPSFGTGSGTGATEFLIGQTTFTISAAAAFFQTTSLAFSPRIRTDGAIAQRKLHSFEIDGGTVISLAGEDANIATIGALVTLVPEPSAIGMLLLGTLGLVGFRRSALRRMVA